MLINVVKVYSPVLAFNIHKTSYELPTMIIWNEF